MSIEMSSPETQAHGGDAPISRDAIGNRVGAVAIGRNEGARLTACLRSLASSLPSAAHGSIIYVDSGSTDGSVKNAEDRGVGVVPLDMSRPFTAARARNEGFCALRDDLTYIQFVDGDCAIAPDWIEKAVAFLDDNPEVALVCGRRRERAPEASIFNRLCDIEWATPIGEAMSSGGDFLVRREAFEAVGGFNPALIAGEEPDLCFRLRREGWKIWRLDEEMTLHDAAMTKIGQWWKRTMRAGYAYANGHALHGGAPEKFRRREVARAVAFGGLLPVGSLFGALFLHPVFLFGFAAYGVQLARVYRQRADLTEGRFAYALSCVFGRGPEFLGVAKFWRSKLAGRQSALIEYK